MITSELPSTPLEEAEFSVLDVETTGLSARNNRVIEIGIVRIKNLKLTDKYSTLINPGCDIPYFITQFTGIANSDVEYSPSFYDTVEEIDNNMLINMHPDAQVQFYDNYETWKRLTAQKKEQLFKKWNSLSVEQQNAMLRKYKKAFSPERRQEMQKFFKKIREKKLERRRQRFSNDKKESRGVP